MRLAPALVVTILLATPGVVAAPMCLPFVLGHSCVSLIAGGNAVGGDFFVLYAPLLLPNEWRSAHAIVGANGAGAGVHGSGMSTGGPIDVWLSVSQSGPHADTYTCFSYPFFPAPCMSTMQRVNGLMPLIPSAPSVPLIP